MDSTKTKEEEKIERKTAPLYAAVTELVSGKGKKHKCQTTLIEAELSSTQHDPMLVLLLQ